MKLLIFGATGSTGRKLVEQGLARGHQITVFVRDASKLPTTNPNVTIVQGELFDYAMIRKAMEGQDAVISTLGNKPATVKRQKNTTISEGLNNIIRAMKEHSVSRIVFVTSFGVSKRVFWPEKLFIKTFLRNIFADLPEQEKLLRTSGLQWTIVRPTRLVEGSRTGRYQVGEELSIGLFSKISRSDVVDFLLEALNQPDTIAKTVTISF